MQTLFGFRDYREFIKTISLARTSGRTQASLAKAMGCQAAYLSQVLQGKGEITEDHALGLCHFLDLGAVETEYFLILVRFSRASTPTLKKHLEERRKQISEQRREIEGRIQTHVLSGKNEATQYYCSSWMPAAIHSATNCAQLQTVSQIAERFFLPESLVKSHLDTLREFGFVRLEKTKYIFQGGSIHIPKGSINDLNFQNSRRLHVLGNLTRRRDEDVHYSNVVAIDAKTAHEIRARVLKLLEKSHRLAEVSPSDEVYSLCLDFFRA